MAPLCPDSGEVLIFDLDTGTIVELYLAVGKSANQPVRSRSAERTIPLPVGPHRVSVAIRAELPVPASMLMRSPGFREVQAPIPVTRAQSDDGVRLHQCRPQPGPPLTRAAVGGHERVPVVAI